MDRDIGSGDEQQPRRPEYDDAFPIRETGAEPKRQESSQQAQQSDDKERPAHSLKILLRGHSLHEWIELLLTVVLAAVGIAYTFYAAKQWDAMRKALDKTDIAIGQTNEALELNRQALELNRRQTVAAESSSVAARSSVEVAKSAMQAGQASIRTDQRPYLVAEGVGFVPANPSGKPPVFELANANVFFRNIGRTPAKTISFYRKVFLMKSQKNGRDVGKIIDREFASVAAIPAESSGHDVSPQGTLFTTASLPSHLTDEELAAVHNTESGLYILGGARYTDAFGQKHETEFCYIVFGTEITVFHFCDTHNSIH